MCNDKMKWELNDVAEFMNFHYDDLVEWIQTTFVGDDRAQMGYNSACVVADEICDKLNHMGKIQSTSQANSKEAKEVVENMMGVNA